MRVTRDEAPVAFFRERGEAALKFRAHARVCKHRRCIARHVPGEHAAGLDIGKNQRAEIDAVRPGQYHIAHIGRESVDDARAQPPGRNPRAGRKLEVFRDASVEQQALAGIVRILERDGVADAVEAFLIDRRFS